MSDLAARFGRLRAVRAGLAEEVAVGQAVVLDGGRRVEEAFPVGRLLGVDLGERDQRRGVGRADDVRVVGGGVDERERRDVGGRDELGRLVGDGSRSGRSKERLRGVRSRRISAPAEAPLSRRMPAIEAKGADDRDAGAADRQAERVAERRAEVAALAAERQEEPDAEHEEPGAERAHVDEVAAAHHQAADDDEHDREREAAPPMSASSPSPIQPPT